jgi:hypothetical protein
MTLTAADVARLRGAGRRRFCRRNRDGIPQLVNHAGHCVFLVDGRCAVYEIRPEGCRLYPLILNLGTNRVERDDFCPWAGEFEFSAEDERALHRSVAAEEREARTPRTGPR